MIDSGKCDGRTAASSSSEIPRVGPRSATARFSSLYRGARGLVFAAVLIASCRSDATDLTAPSRSVTGSLALVIDSLPAGAAPVITVSNAQGYRRELTGPAALSDLPPGNYTVTAADLVVGQDHYSPVPATQSIVVGESGTTTTVSIAYVRVGGLTPGALAVTVAGLPAGTPANLSLTGPDGAAQSVTGSITLTGLASGSYSIVAADVKLSDTIYVAQPTSQVVSVASGVTTTASVSYVGLAAPVEVGSAILTVTMSGLPSGVGGSVTVTGPGGYAQRLTSTQTLTGLVAGTYTIMAGKVTSGGIMYSASPSTQTTSVVSGVTIAASVTYTAPVLPSPILGALAITMTGLPGGASGSVTVSGSGGFSQSVNGATTLGELSPGNYTIAAGNVTISGVAYASSPTSQTATVVAGSTVTVTVAYATVVATPPVSGALTITVSGLPNSIGGNVTVTGPAGFFQWLSNTQTLSGLTAGSYTVAAGSVTTAGITYTAQLVSQVVTVAGGATAATSVTYAAAPPPPPTAGALTVTLLGLPIGVNGNVTVTGPGGVSQLLTGTQTLSGLAPGNYTIAAANVTGGGITYAAQPTTQVVAVALGSTATVTVTYAAVVAPPPVFGGLTVTVSGVPSGASGAVTVTGPGAFSRVLTATQTLTGLTPGAYAIAAAGIAAAGVPYTPSPSNQTQTVVAGASASVSVVYAASNGALTVTLAGLPAGAGGSVTVTGPGGYFRWFTGTQTLNGLAPGNYAIAAGNVTIGGVSYTPSSYSQSQSVTAGSTAGTTVTYTGAASTVGALTVTLTGLPVGVGGSVSVTGPGGYVQSFTSTQTLNSLVPGSYTIAAGNVTISGTTYVPASSSQTKSVVAGATTAAGVSYASASPSVSALAVTVTGLPTGVSASVTVTGSGSFSQFLSSTQTLGGLPVGSYTIAAAIVTSGGITYAPSPMTQTKTTVLGSTISATVTYSTAAPGFANLSPGFQIRTMVVMGTTYTYQIFVPQGYTPTQKWPVVLFLHGSGESGTDGVKEITVGLGPYVQANASTFSAVVVFPQVPPLNGGGALIQLADSIDKTALDQTLGEVRADSTRIYVTGLSQGADFTWDLAYQGSTRYAAIVPIAGGICGTCVAPGSGLSQDSVVALVAQRLKTLQIWVFHGSDDPVASVLEDRMIVAAFQAVGSPIKYTEYPGMGHNVWDITYADPNLWTWLFTQHR